MKYKISDDWDILIAESAQSMVAAGLSVDYPVGSDFQPLQPLQVTSFTPSWDKDRYEDTAWTVNGKIGPLKAIYTGAYMERHISQQMDYTNYSRTIEGQYYQCTGRGRPALAANRSAIRRSPTGRTRSRNTHLSNEVRISVRPTIGACVSSSAAMRNNSASTT